MTQFKYVIRKNRLLILLVALALVRGLIYASVTPPWWQGHDEDFHFAQVKHLIDDRYQQPDQDKSWLLEMTATFVAFPVSRWTPAKEQWPDLVNISHRYSTFTRPSFSYYFFALPGQLLIYQDLLVQLLALRIVSILITCGIIVFAFLAGRQIFPNSVMAQVLIPWFILFNPSFMVINSTVSDGTLAILFTTIIFYLLLLEMQQSHSHWLHWPFLAALALTLLAFWSKATAFFLLPVWGMLLLVYIWRNGGRWLWGIIATVGLLLSLLLLPAYFQNRLLQIWQLLQTDISPAAIKNVLTFSIFWDTFANFWIVLGFFMYSLPQIWYRILFFISMLAGVGLLIFIWHQFKPKRSVPRSEWTGVLLSLLFAGCALVVLAGYTILRQNENLRLARYIFPVILPLSVLMVTGWRALFPIKWKNHGLLLLAGGLFLFDTMVWLQYALPWYYPFWP